MLYFLFPVAIGITIQIIKVIIDFIDEKKIKINNLWKPGGFPSVHSGVSSSITILMFLEFGINSPEFSIALTFSLLFRYDSVNIRYEAGKHARYLNKINLQLKDVLEPLEKYSDLRERLGHTSIEVIGGIIIGAILTINFYYILYN